MAALLAGISLGAGPKGGIADPSDWNVTITYPGGAKQKAAIRLRNGVIYPAINDVPSGRMAVDDAGRLHIWFVGHPKVSRGEAVLERPAPGRWRGVLTQLNGQSVIEMQRK